MDRRYLPYLFAIAFALSMFASVAMIVSAFTRDRSSGQVAVARPPRTSPVAWHDPGSLPIRATRVDLEDRPRPSQVMALQEVPPGRAESDADVADALAQAQAFTADFDTAKFDVVADHVHDPVKAQAILESDLRSRDVTHAFASAPDWLRHLAIDQAVEDGAAREDEILQDPAVADRMIQDLAQRLQPTEIEPSDTQGSR